MFHLNVGWITFHAISDLQKSTQILFWMRIIVLSFKGYLFLNKDKPADYNEAQQFYKGQKNRIGKVKGLSLIGQSTLK